MTPFLESKWTTLRNMAVAYYNAVIWPSTPEDFDATNPSPRRTLNVELDRISAKERKETGRVSW